MTQKPALTHLAIIPDGNRRWAKKHGLKGQAQIYQQGSNKTFEIINAAFEYGVPYVTFWASSYANLADRPKAFVEAMEKTYIQKFNELAEHPLIHKNQVKIEILGQWREVLQPKTTAALQNSIDKTAHYTSRHLTILVSYDGRHERGAAVKKIFQDVQVSALQDSKIPEVEPKNLSAEIYNSLESSAGGSSRVNANLQSTNLDELDALLRRHSWTGHLPEIDLTIRTGAWADPHNSAGFLSLLTSETQYAYPEVLWPDFTPQMLNQILNDYAARERRLGK